MAPTSRVSWPSWFLDQTKVRLAEGEALILEHVSSVSYRLVNGSRVDGDPLTVSDGALRWNPIEFQMQQHGALHGCTMHSFSLMSAFMVLTPNSQQIHRSFSAWKVISGRYMRGGASGGPQADVSCIDRH